MSIMHFDTTTGTQQVIVDLQNSNLSHTSTIDTEVTINYRSIGDVTFRKNGATTSQYDWIFPTSFAPGSPVYQVSRGPAAPFDLGEGVDPGYGPFAGVWTNVGVGAFWGFVRLTVGTTTSTFDVSIRQGVGGSVIDTCTVTLTATKTTSGGGGGCFTGNMLVLMADGTEKPIADIMAGELVMSLDVENNKLVSAKVQDLMIPRVCNIYELRLSNGKVIETTIEHPFRTANGKWANIDTNATYRTVSGNIHKPEVDIQLAEGMLLRGAEGTARIMKIVDTGRTETVYNLSRVGPHRNYFVEGMCVHNIEFLELK